MNAIIITLYCEALVLFAFIAIRLWNAKHEAVKHEAGELRVHVVR